MDTKEILGHLRTAEYNELYKQHLALNAMDELNPLHDTNLEKLLDKQSDDGLSGESLRVKRNIEKMREIWRRGGTPVLGDGEVHELKPEDYPREDRPKHTEPKTTTLPTEFEKLKAEWSKGMAKRFLLKLEEKGIIMPNGDVYDWKIDSKHGYGINLYVYFCWMASEKLEWREGKKKDRMPWKKFNPMFPNVSTNRGTLTDALNTIRRNTSLPTLASVIDQILGR